MLTNSSLKTEYSRLYPAIAEEEPEEEASPTSTSPTSMTAAFQEFITAEKRAAPTPSSDLCRALHKDRRETPLLGTAAFCLIYCASYFSGG